eukprot:TRINITY_DN57224_c0_g1_i1.p1 TRINITY_DN57224_c0_g1~~TRINITY_DN57224_c0_g1_i1.p1  ORF type:complete len:495 (-),score=84.78 TRINITY_DN57224_c0_g1_i1:197-1681(-)
MAPEPVSMLPSAAECADGGPEAMISTLSDLIATVEALVSKALFAGGGAAAAVEAVVNRCLRKELRLVAESELAGRPEDAMRFHLSEQVEQRFLQVEQRLDRTEEREATIDATIARLANSVAQAENPLNAVARNVADAEERANVRAKEVFAKVDAVEEKLTELSRRAATREYVAAMAAAIESRQPRRGAAGDVDVFGGAIGVLDATGSSRFATDSVSRVEARAADIALATDKTNRGGHDGAKLDVADHGDLETDSIDCGSQEREVLESMRNKVADNLDRIDALAAAKTSVSTNSTVLTAVACSLGVSNMEAPCDSAFSKEKHHSTNPTSAYLSDDVLDRSFASSTTASLRPGSQQTAADSPSVASDFCRDRGSPLGHHSYAMSSRPSKPTQCNELCLAGRGSSVDPNASSQRPASANACSTLPPNVRGASGGSCYREAAQRPSSATARSSIQERVLLTSKQQNIAARLRMTRDLRREVQQVSFTNSSTFTSRIDR